jgi:hypothetical protein
VGKKGKLKIFETIKTILDDLASVGVKFGLSTAVKFHNGKVHFFYVYRCGCFFVLCTNFDSSLFYQCDVIVLPMWRHCSTNVTSLFYPRVVFFLPIRLLFMYQFVIFVLPMCLTFSTKLSLFYQFGVFVLTKRLLFVPIWPLFVPVWFLLCCTDGTFLLMVHFHHFASAQISFYSRCVPSGSSAAAFFTFSLFLIDMSRGVLLSGDFSCKFVKSKISRQPFVFVCLFWA